MRCFASIDRIEGKFAVSEVNVFLLEDEELQVIGHEMTDCPMADIPLQQIPDEIGEVNEGDILVVEYDGKNVTKVYCKDDEEKARRLKLLKEVMGW